MALADVKFKPHRSFKDFADMDIGEAFFNANEHAEKHKVDGKECLVIIEDLSLSEHEAHWEAGAKQSFDSGLYDAQVIIYIKILDYGTKPKSGKLIVLDEGTSKKRTYRVTACQEESGVYRITAGRQRQ